VRLDGVLLKDEHLSAYRKGGCVALSFGMEVATQRVMDLIDKGVKVAKIVPILEELARNGIGAQLMCFAGFPTETYQEACETAQFLLDNKEHWTIANITPFGLDRGSILEQMPGQFGLTVDHENRGLLPHSLHWQDATGRSDKDAHEWLRREDWPDAEKAHPLTRWVLNRPYVGGTDSPATILYFSRYGPGLIPEQQLQNLARHRDRQRMAGWRKFLADGGFPYNHKFQGGVIRGEVEGSCEGFQQWLEAPIEREAWLQMKLKRFRRL
jgi:hypothetical protein